MRISFTTRMIAAALTVLSCTTTSTLAQHVPEFVPRLGERRLSRNIFKASHNSYDRNETLVDQIDNYNCWCLELDCHWEDGAIHVMHDCDDPDELLSTKFDKINDSILAPYKVTVIWLEWKGACNGSPSNQMVYDNLVGAMNTFFGLGNLYSPQEFTVVAGDHKQWPSWQELVRRQRRWIIVAENWPVPDSPYFFKSLSTGNLPPDANLPSDGTRAFYNRHEYDASAPLNDYWMSRGYPDPVCGETVGPGYEDSGEWNLGVLAPYNLVATNCISNDHTEDDDRVHPPQPCFVTRNDIGSAHEYGTLRNPFWGLGVNGGGLLGAVHRVRTYGDLSEIWVQEGDYDFSGPIEINGPCVITNWTGNGTAVVIR